MQKLNHEFKEYWGEAFLRYWDFDKNEEEGIFLENLTRGLKGVKGYFICDNGHHIYRAINQMYRATADSPEGDMYRLKCKECNRLTYRFPEVYRYWSDKNSKSPDMYSAKPSNVKAWWVCDNGHEKSRLISSVVDTYERGNEFVCDTCRSMYVKYPELERYWSTNNKEDFIDITHGRQDVFLWVCENGHETSKTLQAAISRYKTHRDYRCNECNWEPIKGSNLERYWDYEENSRSIDDVSDTATFECYFTCDKGHTVKKPVYHVTSSYSSHGKYRCDICNLAINRFPEIAQYWSDKNTVPIDKYSYGASKKVYWVCENDHHVKRSFQSVCNCLRKGSGFGCVECKKLAFKRPDLIDEWSGKNKKNISNYSYSSGYKAWWKCLNGHSDYKAIIYNRSHGHDGCPVCVTSKGEKLTEEILRDVFKVEYIKQKSFDGCKYIKRLRFDFYLPEYNTCIEYDGRQHFTPVEVFGGEEGYFKTKKRDGIKNKYCKDNNIGLIRIPYNQINNIEEILLKELINKGGLI